MDCVYCVFFVSDETLEWELDKIFRSEHQADLYVAEWDLVTPEDEGLEFKVEKWVVK